MGDEIYKLILEKPDCCVQIIKARYHDFYKKIDEEYSGSKFSEKLYIHYNGKPICKVCGNDTKFMSFQKGYREFCSPKCSNVFNRENLMEKHSEWVSSKHETKICLHCKKEFTALISRDSKYCSHQCSVEAIGNSEERLQKIRDTKLERYGDAGYTNRDKQKETNLNRYGFENAAKSEEVKKKIKTTNKEKYGTYHYFQSDVAKIKNKEIIQKKYNVDNYSQTEECKNKVKKTVERKFGVDNVFKSSDIKKKIKIKNFELYGVEYPSQNPTIRSKISAKSRITNFKNVVNRIQKNTDIIPLFTIDDYKTTDSVNKYSFLCSNCVQEFEDHIDGGHLPRCLQCNPYILDNKISKSEIELGEYITSLDIDCEFNNKKILDGKELDIFIPEKNIAIEYNGLYWHSENNGGKDKNYHLNKTNHCNDKGIHLIHVFEDEWIYKKDVVKSKLRHILCAADEKIYARKCKLHEISNIDKLDFLDTNHIQGNDMSSIRVGAYHGDELVAVMTFGKLRTALGQTSKKEHYELLRFATKKLVVGVASKLFKYFKTTYNPKYVVSYCDLRYGTGCVYTHMGFTYIKTSLPNYWYFKVGNYIRYHRYNFAKHKLKDKLDIFDPELTEWQNMQLNGYDRIWDCGNLKFEWKA